MELLNKIGLIIGLMMLIGAAFAVAKGSFNKSRIEALREDNTDLRNRVADLESTVERLEAADQAHLVVEQALQDKNTVLEGMLIQRADVEGVKAQVTILIRLLNSHHDQAMQRLDAIAKAFTKGKNSE